MHKNDEVVTILIEIRDLCEDALDVLNPPPVDESLESATSEAPPQRGVVRPRAKRTAKTVRRLFAPR